MFSLRFAWCWFDVLCGCGLVWVRFIVIVVCWCLYVVLVVGMFGDFLGVWFDCVCYLVLWFGFRVAVVSGGFNAVLYKWLWLFG